MLSVKKGRSSVLTHWKKLERRDRGKRITSCMLTSTPGVHKMRLLHRHLLKDCLWGRLMICTLKNGKVAFTILGWHTDTDSQPDASFHRRRQLPSYMYLHLDVIFQLSLTFSWSNFVVFGTLEMTLFVVWKNHGMERRTRPFMEMRCCI